MSGHQIPYSRRRIRTTSKSIIKPADENLLYADYHVASPYVYPPNGISDPNWWNGLQTNAEDADYSYVND